MKAPSVGGFSIGNPRRRLRPRPPSPYYLSSTPSGASGFQGNDPVLGPPYAPIQYQLFVVPLSASDFPAPPGPLATLYWTVPPLTDFAYSVIHQLPFPGTPHLFWYSNSNNPHTALPATPIPGTNNAWIPAANFVWATLLNTIPLIPGIAIPGGTNFLGDFVYQSGNFAGFVLWANQPADSISHFTLERAINNGSSWVMLQSNIPAANRIAPDFQGRDIANHYFYRMVGFTANGLAFPYNVVGLIHPYVLEARVVLLNNRFDHTELTWTAPIPAEVALWPTSKP